MKKEQTQKRNTAEPVLAEPEPIEVGPDPALEADPIPVDISSDEPVMEIFIPTNRSFDEIVQEVREGKWGRGQERRLRLSQAGYDHVAVQKELVRILNDK